MGAGATALYTRTWEINLKNRLAETTNSATSGLATWFATVSEADFSCEAIWDDAEIPDTDNGLTRGASLTVKLNIGNSAKFYTGTALIETLTVKVDNIQGVVIYNITGKYTGAITLPVT